MHKKNEKLLINWLFLGVFLIVLMIAVGGIVRLTNSGLSIVTWKPITGIIPPITQQEWQKEFEAYKNIPEFKIEHHFFSLSDFKNIYYLEYFHRLVARIVGFIFLIPFLFFWIKGYFKNKKLLFRIASIFFIAMFQAWLGWYMVSSGLSDRTDVSHYRLAIHLFVATFLVSFVLWTALELKYNNSIFPKLKGLKNWSVITLFLLSIQLMFGALTAGLNAGYYYMSYPKMGGDWFPNLGAQAFKKTGFISIFEDPSMVHFIHRWFAVLVLLAIVLFFHKFKNKNTSSELKFILHTIITLVSIQFVLGIATLLTKMNIVLAVLHQINGILLFLSVVLVLFFSRKKSSNIIS